MSRQTFRLPLESKRIMDVAPHRYPLAWTLENEPLEPPSNAVAWRVRRVQRSWQGFDVVTVRPTHLMRWVPLVLQLRATRTELARAVDATDGLYRLDPIDEHGQVLAWPPAYVRIESNRGTHSSNPQHPRYRAVMFSPCTLP